MNNLTPILQFDPSRLGEWTKLQRTRGQRLNHRPPMEETIAFTLWAARLGTFPTPAQIRDRFGCSRAASYRWRDTLAKVMGVPAPEVKRIRKRGVFAKRAA